MNFSETNPITLLSRIDAVEAAIQADESALFTSATGSSCDIKTTALITPLNVAVANVGTVGSTTVGYVVADVGNGGTFSPTAEVQTTTSNATLTASNYNTITWASIIGHTYNIYRSTAPSTPSTTGLIGTVTATGLSSSFSDTAKAGTGNVPTVNTTGALLPVGPVFAGAQVFGNGTPATLNTVGAATLTVAQILSGIIVRGGTQVGGFIDTTPTAAALVAALPGVKVGNFIHLFVRNTTGQTHTLAAGTGVTLATGNTNTTATVSSHEFRVVFTNVTVGSEAVTIYSMGAASAY